MPKAVSRLEALQVCKLLQCVGQRDKQQVEKLTVSGVPNLVNYNDPIEGNTALIIAAIANDEDMIDFLLELGAHPDVRDHKGRTAATLAAEYGHVNCLEKLLAAGANMVIDDMDGKGIIFYCIASTERHAKCLQLALSHGADVNNLSRDGNPVFSLACETALENEQTCLTLLEKGADPNSKMEKSGRTALMSACGSGSSKVVKTILSKGATVNVLDVRKNHAAHFAAKGGHIECLTSIGGFGANFDVPNMDGSTPIHLAAKGGHAMCCKYLSQRGCNPKVKDKEGNTACAIAREEGHKEAMKELCKAEKSFGKVGKNNERSALAFYDWLVERQDRVSEVLRKVDVDQTGSIPKEEFCDTLRSLGAPIEMDQLAKLAALHDKAREGKVDYADLLTGRRWINKNYLRSAFEGKKKKKGQGKGKRGGQRKGKFELVMPICTRDEGSRTSGGGPPEMYIRRHINFTDACRFDRDHPPNHPLQDDSAWYLQQSDRAYISLNEAAKTGDFESVKSAQVKGVYVDTRDKYYKTPLMTASATGHLDMVQFLVGKGAGVNARDNFKWTPLHHACHGGQLDVVQLLVDSGAEVDATTMAGGTPLTRAIESCKEDVVQYLIDRGVKMQTENKIGMSPLGVAECWADPRVFSIVQTKWDTVTSVDKNKARKWAKGKGGGGPAKAQRPASAPADSKTEGEMRKPGEIMPARRKGSILQAASAMAEGLLGDDDITFVPLQTWTRQPNTQQLIRDKQVRRQRFGWEVDFPDFQMPFQKNVSNKMASMDMD